MHCRQNIHFFVSYKRSSLITKHANMQRRDSLGETTKFLRLSSGSTLRFKLRRSQSLISSIFNVFASGATSEGHSDLSVSGMKLES